MASDVSQLSSSYRTDDLIMNNKMLDRKLDGETMVNLNT